MTSLEHVLQRQSGVASGDQLAAHGVPYSLTRSRCRSGGWQRLHYNVYATFSGEPGRLAVIWAAILRCGAGAVASHETAAELYGLTDDVADPIHVTVDARRRVRGRLGGIVVHYDHRLDLTRHPVGSPPRTRLEDTVLDLVGTSTSARRAAAWLVIAVQRRRTTTTRLAAALARRKKIKWRAMAEAMLLDVAHGAHSMLEVEHLRRVERAHALPAGRRQRRVAGQRVIWIDVEREEHATRIELDGRVGHVEDGAFRDRRRDNTGVIAGMWTLRYGHAEIFGDPCGVAAEQAAAFQDRGWRGSPRPCGPDCAVIVTLAEVRRRRAA